MITIAVCDDDVSYLNNTLYRSVLAATYKAKIQARISLFSSGNKLLNEYKNGKTFDIVILDINMPYINGKELAERLRLIDFSFFLVFVTSNEEELENTIRYRINAFISKNGGRKKMNDEFVRVFREYLCVKPQYEFFEILREGLLSALRVEISNILGFYLSEKIIYLKTATNDYILKERRFKQISDRFLDKNFFECCRNYIVNINRITEITDSAVILENGDKFPISKRNYSKLVKEFSIRVMEEADN